MFTPEDHRNTLIELGFKSGMEKGELGQFIGNMEHETGGFTKFKESTNYRPARLLEIFGPKLPKRPIGRNGLTTLKQAEKICAGGPIAIAEFIYGGDWGKKNLGNLFPGDGAKFIGRGYLQLTGRSNYTSIGNALKIDLVTNPEIACDPETAGRIALYFWETRGASKAAREGDYKLARIKINGGLLGYDEIQTTANSLYESEMIANLYNEDKGMIA